MRFYTITAGLLFCLFLFLACGEGTISGADVSDDLALLNYGEFNPEGMTSLVNYPPPKGGELLVFASTEPLVLTQQNWVA